MGLRTLFVVTMSRSPRRRGALKDRTKDGMVEEEQDTGKGGSLRSRKGREVQ